MGMRSRRYFRLLAALGVVVIVAGVVTSVVPRAAQGASSGWVAVNGGAPDPQASQLLLNTTCANAWDCWAVGASFPQVQNAQPQALAEHWDGSSWSDVSGVQPPGQQASVLYDVSCVTSSDCWGVGGQQTVSQGNDPTVLMEHWNGAGWSVAATPSIGGLLFSVSCPAAGDCWAVGATLDPVSGDAIGSLAFHWNGSSWTMAALPASGLSDEQLSSITCINATDCWAVGTASANPFDSDILPNLLYKSQGAEPWMLHWDGSTWSGSAQADPQSPTGAALTGVTCAASTDCWAVGSTMNAAGHFSEPLAERWDGATWSVVPTPTSNNGTLNNVTCLSASACWAVGAFSVPTGQGQQNGSDPQSLIERWDGSSWSVDGSPDVSTISVLYGVACSRGAQCFATGFSASDPNNFAPQTLTEENMLPANGSQGFEAVAADGGMFNLGDAGFFGSMGGRRLVAPTVGTSVTADGRGYWLVATDGGVFSFGDAGFFGSMGGNRLNAPIVGMTATPDGGGYWLVAADGGVFSFGDAGFFGSMGGNRLNAPIVGMTATPDGGGYWLVAADGGVFSFGDAGFFGSMGGSLGGNRATALAATPNGGGYWILGRDGGIFAFGNAGFFGSVPQQGLMADAPVTGISISPDGRGYWLVAANGSVDNFGDASWLGALNDIGLRAPLTGVSQSG